MRRIRLANENEMVCEFLKMELSSERYREQIKTVLKELTLNDDVITNGNISSDDENIARQHIFRRFRGWRERKLFERFPLKIDWAWTVFDRADISKIMYMNYSYWNELSNYTGSPLEAARVIRLGENENFLKDFH